MTEYKVGDVVRATNSSGAIIEAALFEAWGDPMIPFIGYTVADALNGGWTVELIKAAPSATRKALDDAPFGSTVSRGPGYRLFLKMPEEWLEVNMGRARLDTLSAARVTLDDLADWITNDKFTLTTPNGE